MTERKRPEVDPRRLALVNDPEVRAYVRAVLRKRGVPRQDRDDGVDLVMECVLRAKHIPIHDPAASKRYAGGIARHVGIRAAHERKKDREMVRLDAREGRREIAQEVAPEVRFVAQAADAEGHKHFGLFFDWFVQNRVQGDTFEVIAERANKSPGYVRNRVSLVQRQLPGLLKASGITLTILLAFGLLRGRWTYEHVYMAPSDSMATLRQDTVPRDATALRARAAAAADAGAWQAVLDDLDAARQLDGEDRGPAERLRREANSYLRTTDAAPQNAVPGKR